MEPNKEKEEKIGRFWRLFRYGFYFGLFFFPISAFIIPEEGIRFPGEAFLCETFPAINIYSQGSFDPELSKTFFSFAFLYFLTMILGIIVTFPYDFATKDKCLDTIKKVREKFKGREIHLSFGILFLYFSMIYTILMDFDIFPESVSMSAFTGYGLSLHAMKQAPLAPYIEPMYYSRIGLAIGGLMVVLIGYISIIGIPIMFRSIRCLILANKQMFSDDH